jgi:hypothetical protein
MQFVHAQRFFFGGFNYLEMIITSGEFFRTLFSASYTVRARRGATSILRLFNTKPSFRLTLQSSTLIYLEISAYSVSLPVGQYHLHCGDKMRWIAIPGIGDYASESIAIESSSYATHSPSTAEIERSSLFARTGYAPLRADH